jgi:hypothetical protein
MTVQFGNPGSVEESKFVPMGAFGILRKNVHTRRYLKSTSFASCIGVAIYIVEQHAGVLAHFMSHNSIRKSMTAIGRELNNLQISSKGRNWDAMIFAGGQFSKAKSKSKSTFSGGLDIAVREESLTTALQRLQEIKKDLEGFGATAAIYKDGDEGFESCALDVESGVLSLSNEDVAGKHKNSQAAVCDQNAALLLDTKDMV